MNKRILLPLLILLIQVTAPAQTSMNATASESERIADFEKMFEIQEILTLLESENSREQAWGAWLAGQGQYRRTIPLLQQIVKTRLKGSDWRTDKPPLDAALDALILLDAEVPIDLISEIFPKRPAQALVLVSKHKSGCDEFLLECATHEKGIKWFAAANLMLSHHTPGMAPILLRDIEITAVIIVIVGNRSGGVEGGGSVGFSDGGFGRLDGYPPMAYYYLTGSAWSGSSVLATGPVMVYYRRNILPFGASSAGPTHNISGPSTTDYLKYLKALMGGFQDLPVEAIEYRSHEWQGQNALDQEIADFKQDILRRYSLLIRKVVNAKLLTEEDASRLPEPEIKVQINFPPEFKTE